MNPLFSTHWILIGAVWYFTNGLLHDIFVLRQHKKKYDRELLRLLMDGHILLLSGVLMFVCWKMIGHKVWWGALVSTIVSGFMLIYCSMIYPFLKSIATIFLTIILMIVSLLAMRNLFA